MQTEHFLQHAMSQQVRGMAPPFRYYQQNLHSGAFSALSADLSPREKLDASEADDISSSGIATLWGAAAPLEAEFLNIGH